MTMPQTIRHPDGRVFVVPSFIRPPDEAAERDQLLAAQYFLVKQGSLGEIFRCSRCQGKHVYLSLMCVERPFSGLAEGLWAYYQTAGTPQAMARLTPDERRRVATVKRLFGPAATVPDLSDAHPEFARALHVAERDLQMGGVPLGILEPIPPTLAQRLQDRINLRGIKPPLALEGLKES